MASVATTLDRLDTVYSADAVEVTFVFGQGPYSSRASNPR